LGIDDECGTMIAEFRRIAAFGKKATVHGAERSPAESRICLRSYRIAHLLFKPELDIRAGQRQASGHILIEFSSRHSDFGLQENAPARLTYESVVAEIPFD
jgi:hypothetical protein